MSKIEKNAEKQKLTVHGHLKHHDHRWEIRHLFPFTIFLLEHTISKNFHQNILVIGLLKVFCTCECRSEISVSAENMQ